MPKTDVISGGFSVLCLRDCFFGEDSWYCCCSSGGFLGVKLSFYWTSIPYNICQNDAPCSIRISSSPALDSRPFLWIRTFGQSTLSQPYVTFIPSHVSSFCGFLGVVFCFPFQRGDFLVSAILTSKQMGWKRTQMVFLSRWLYRRLCHLTLATSTSHPSCITPHPTTEPRLLACSAVSTAVPFHFRAGLDLRSGLFCAFVCRSFVD